MSKLIVQPQTRPLSGSVPVPSDKSIGHRALIFSALSRGSCKLSSFSYGEDNVATMNAFRAMGVSFDDDGKGTLIAHGVGLDGLDAPSDALDCGNSGTTMRLLAGLLSAQPFDSRLVGDESLSRRPMMRIAGPLSKRGARIAGQPHPKKEGDITAPLEISGVERGSHLSGLEYAMPIASAQVKSALLISGLYASGPTIVSEPMVSRDHTERMLEALRIPLETVGSMVKLHPPADPRCIEPFEVEIPGDASAAAFILAAGLMVEGSRVTTRKTGLNPTRTGFLDLVRQLGGKLGVQPQRVSLGESEGLVTAEHGSLRGAAIGGEVAVRAIDEIPIAAAVAARAHGTTEFHDVGELRVKESDRIGEMISVLRGFGLEAEELDTGLAVQGQPSGTLKASHVQSRGDHRIAMTGAVLALCADGESVIDDVDCIATSFPRFVGTLRALGARIEVKP